MDISIQTCAGQVIRYTDIRGILFDLDGTLLDTLDLHIESFQKILSDHNVIVGDIELESFMGRTPQDILSYYLPNLDSDSIWDVAIQKEEYLYTLIPNSNSIRIFPGVISLLEQLGEISIPRIVISSTHRSLVNRLLSNANIVELLDEMVPGDEVVRGKPDPDPFLQGAIKSGVDKEFVVGVGDSIYDYQSCFTAGIRFIGTTTGKTNYMKFRNNNVLSVVNSFDDIRIK
jgi:beta-phosphoglucomutase-like phosphatase (HAD superfamily)